MQKHFFLWALWVFGLPLLSLAQDKPQIIVLTDIGGDTDDEQSLARFLYYADHFDIKGLCATSRLGHGQDTKPEIIHSQLQAYREVYPNLLLHSQDFPDPDQLERLVKNGQGDHKSLGEGHDTEASDHIIQVIDGTDHTVHIAVWGGLRELAQALWKVKENRNSEQLEAFCKKIQVHAIGDQDGHRDYMLKEFKDVKFIANGFAWYGFAGVRELSAFRGMYMTGDVSMQDGDWVRTEIHGNGPLSEKYQLHGHGTDGMKEGDTPSFLGLLENGLNVPEKPEYGGWGGRYRWLNNHLYIDVPDFLEGKLNERHTVARWRSAFQRDFMARVKWATMSFAEANHNPVVIINGGKSTFPLELEAKAGERVVLDASQSSDPDGDALEFHWFVYDEIFRASEPIRFEMENQGAKASFKMPELPKGEKIHIIAEVTDNGQPAMTRYRRIILTTL
ncbi:nucleoside hydrolase-like domain-containing protein [Negadavirga shengliensis]|uniref:Nucleoside hydrolase-like domain-containing protein n=1 Tax=Negadavirga shengliensis TaxID=1389218 RepID=A0ABV9SWW7_9BACT